jgi:hypothetical protein
MAPIDSVCGDEKSHEIDVSRNWKIEEIENESHQK